MEFGINFFPSHSDAVKPYAQYWRECMKLVEVGDALGYHHARTVEHYFLDYGGTSPNPIVFLTGCAQHSKRMKLVTGAVLPVFNHPLKLAGELAMLDGASQGRLEIGFARAFLPHEFATFGISPDESRARFEEGQRQVLLLLSQEKASSQGRFHAFKDITSLPRPTQRPHPPVYVATFTTKESFTYAGKNGYGVMSIPIAGPIMNELLGEYREAWRQAGHKGNGKIMIAHHMYCAPTTEQAIADSRDALNGYVHELYNAASAWVTGASSRDYPGYEKAIAALKNDNFDNLRARSLAWCGTPEEICDMIRTCYAPIKEGVDIASCQVNFHNIALDKAEASMRLFAEKVMPKFKGAKTAA